MSTLQGPSKLVCADGVRAPAESVVATNTAAATGPCQINLFHNIATLLITRHVHQGPVSAIIRRGQAGSVEFQSPETPLIERRSRRQNCVILRNLSPVCIRPSRQGDLSGGRIA